MMRPICSSALSRAIRFNSTGKDGKRRDLFGYEQSSEVGPWNDKISKVKTWNEAGELLVEMNRANCPPDLSSYKEVLKAILRCSSKYDGGRQAGESKFCAMMDVLEEMEHRNNTKTDLPCWDLVMEGAIQEQEFRAGRALIACVEGISQKLVDENEKVAAKLKSEGQEFPPALLKQSENLFDIEIKAA
ncbi:Protein P18 [Diplonema papillatum]|nr:Protein P18 [Diplonema papillatum]